MTNGEPDSRGILEAARLLREARSVVVLTGAGVSAESGVPTFRDARTGLWARYDPEALASTEGFAANPGLVWRWYMSRFGGLGEVRPNPGHHALAAIEAWITGAAPAPSAIAPSERGGPPGASAPVQEMEGATARLPRRDSPGAFAIYTQNVDNLHERAGSVRVHHLHGRIHRYRCHLCGQPHELSAADREAPEPPRCDACGGPVRPDVVWFGENLPEEVLAGATRAALTCSVMLVAGTSGQVYPAAQLPWTARQSGASVIDVNPVPTPISEMADLHLQGPSGIVLPRVLEALASIP